MRYRLRWTKMVVCQLNGNDERVFQEIKSEDEKKKKRRTNAVVAINRVDLLFDVDCVYNFHKLKISNILVWFF